MSFRYLGNKTRLADWIVNRISEVVPAGGTIADPMCGTASVSFALARQGYNVIASDALRFPTVHATARLLAKHEPTFSSLQGYREAVRWLNSLAPTEGYFFREFGEYGAPENGRGSRLYFSASNAAKIDGVRAGIIELRDSGMLTRIEHYVLLNHLILAVNSVANISGTYGYFHTSLLRSARKPIEFNEQEFVATPGTHRVFQASIEDCAADLEADGVYLDPPYTKRQYAGNYHILETLALEDEPEAVGDGGLRPWTDNASAFCYKRSAPDAFRQVLSRLNTPHVFISYSEDGQVPLDRMWSILRQFGDVDLASRSLPRYRSNGRAQEGDVLELLFHVRMR